MIAGSLSKLFVPYCEFYITHSCNLACPGCNRFNDYKFVGYQKWSEYEKIYQDWGRHIEIGQMAILGGEPLLNPSVKSWVKGIRNIWKKPFLRIITNGFYLDKISGLYDLVRQDPNIQIWVGIHNKTHKQKIIDKVTSFLKTPVKYEFDQSIPYQEKLFVSDSNGVKIVVEYNWWFHQGSLIKNHETGKLGLHDSNPEKAHSNCHMKTCHHFKDGKLYKCGVVAVLEDFDRQHHLNLSNQDRNLMKQYKPLTVGDDWETKKKFISELPKTISQCKFCPEVYDGDQIFSKEKREIKIETI